MGRVNRIGWLAVVMGAVACGSGEDQDTAVQLGTEPLVLPDDPAEKGVPVGVRTEVWDGLTVEVWYPASDTTTGETDSVDFSQWVPTSVAALLGDVEVPLIATDAVRDAPARRAEEPFPVVFFSHGLGGTRMQSTDLTVHLASRGYVVVASDHAGRSFPDLLPCLFTPPAEGCDLAGLLGEDPGTGDASAVADYLPTAASEGFLADRIDPARLGIFGHSAGGGTTSSILSTDPRFLAGIPMAGADAIDGDAAVLVLAGSCDATVPLSAIAAAADATPQATLVTIEGAGHLAFSDLCELEFGDLYDNYLAEREDLNAFFADTLLALGTDGCPGYNPPQPECGSAWLDLGVSDPISRHYVTVFFDKELKGLGDGAQDGVFPEVVLSAR